MRAWLLTCVVFIWLVAAVEGGANLLVQVAALLFPGQGIDNAIAQAAQAIDNTFDGFRASLATAGILVIKIAVFLGFLFNYKDQVMAANEISKEAKAEERVEHLPSWLKNPGEEEYHPFHPTYPSYKNARQSKQKRAILNPFSFTKEGIENRMAAAVTSLDSHGCLNKLMCHFNNKHPSDLASEEYLMMRLFSSGLPESKQGRSCSELFPYCSASEEDLSEIFTSSWSYLRGTLNN